MRVIQKTFDDFSNVFVANIQSRSRTSKGTSDTSASITKRKLLLAGDALKAQVEENTTALVLSVWQRARCVPSPQTLRSLMQHWYDVINNKLQYPYIYISDWTCLIQDDLQKDTRHEYRINTRYRTWDVSYSSLHIHPLDLEDAMDNFYAILSRAIVEAQRGARSSLELLAYADHMIDAEIHPWADGCGRISTALIMWLSLIVPAGGWPLFGTRTEHYQHIGNLPLHTAYFMECMLRTLPNTGVV